MPKTCCMLRQFKIPPGVSQVQESQQGGMFMNLNAAPVEIKSVFPTPAKRASRPVISHSLGWACVLALLIACPITPGQTKAAKEDYVKVSAPKPLAFDDLVELEKADDPNPQLAARLDKLLHTPFLSNEAFYD